MGVSDGKLLRKPRLLIILNRFVIGGQAVDTLPLAYFLQQHFDILILYGEKEKDEVEPFYLLDQYPNLSLRKIPSLRRSINPLIDIVAFSKIFSIIKEFKADIVHTHGAKSGFLGRLAAYFVRTPVIIHTFHGHFFHSYFSNTLSSLIAFVERAIGKITTAAVALSESQKEDLVNKFKVIPTDKLHIIPLGFTYSISANKNLRSNFRNNYSLEDTDVAIGIVGRIVPVKNHFLFIDVIDIVLKENPNLNVVFFIVGDGEIRMQLEETLVNRNINYSINNRDNNCKVVFTSRLSDVEEIMTGLDIVVLTSNNEGTPLSLIEAQFFGKPVVSTNVGGVRDTIDEKESGFLVEPGDAPAFAEKLSLLIDDPFLRDTMGKKGQEFVRRKFSKEAEIAATQQFYFSLLAEKNIYLKTDLESPNTNSGNSIR